MKVVARLGGSDLLLSADFPMPAISSSSVLIGVCEQKNLTIPLRFLYLILQYLYNSRIRGFM